MPGPASTENVIAALASFFLPGLGQLIQGRLGKAIFMVIAGVILWVISLGTLGWIIHVWAAIDAALYKPRWDQ